MKNENEKRPSDFALSRYILNECDQEEKRRVESWINFSEKTNEEFVSFQKSIYREEQSTFPFFMKNKTTNKKINQLFLTKVLTSKLRYGLACSVIAALFLVSYLTIDRLSDKSITKYSGQTGSHYPVFRDTLEALLRLTSKNIPEISFQTFDQADRTDYNKKDHYQTRGIYRADRTVMYKEFNN